MIVWGLRLSRLCLKCLTRTSTRLEIWPNSCIGPVFKWGVHSAVLRPADNSKLPGNLLILRGIFCGPTCRKITQIWSPMKWVSLAHTHDGFHPLCFSFSNSWFAVSWAGSWRRGVVSLWQLVWWTLYYIIHAECMWHMNNIKLLICNSTIYWVVTCHANLAHLHAYACIANSTVTCTVALLSHYRVTWHVKAFMGHP